MKIDKPWGYEILLTDSNLPYTAKILHIKKDQQISLQYHDQKTETLTLFSGECQIITGKDPQNLAQDNMKLFFGYTILPNTIHQIKTNTDCVLFEASTPELGTTYRLKDKYGRSDESPELRKLERNSNE